MDARIAFDKICHLVLEKSPGRNITPLEKAIFIGSWDDKTYGVIAKTFNRYPTEEDPYKSDYVKTEGNRLWEFLNALLGINVSKKTLRTNIEAYFNPNLIDEQEVNKLKLSASAAMTRKDYEEAIDLWYRVSIETLGRDNTEVFQAIRELEKGRKDITIENHTYPSSSDYASLMKCIKDREWIQADLLTTEIFLKSINLGLDDWITDKHIEKISRTTIQGLDNIWKDGSEGIYGFSVQKRIWKLIRGESKANYEFWKKFGDVVGWRGRKDTDFDGWNYYENTNRRIPKFLGEFPSAPAGKLMWEWGSASLGSFWNLFMDAI
jgi:GUN4-like